MIREYIYNTVKKRAMHFTLIDPDPRKLRNLKEKIRSLEAFGTDAILIGGSTNVNQSFLDSTIKTIKNTSRIPVMLFPGGLNGLSKYADALLFMSLMNSKDPYWITGVQAKGSLSVKEIDVETIPMAYLIVEPGMKVGEVGKADLIKRKDINRAVSYALAAQYLGMALVYLEAGSGANRPVPPEMIRAVKKNIDIPLIVGGGIRSAKQAKECVRAGADIINTGTITEENFSAIREIISVVKNHKK
ncbi:MAG: geranylgeranylglyceryl/heptaprenylglyceryl phosphate synthase [Candidatus Aenigmatarchaeota archaeon]